MSQLFCPFTKVGDCSISDFLVNKTNDEKVDAFCDYLLTFYISKNATFPPYMWASLTVDFFKETTNACESFLSHLGQEFYHSHPSIFSFVNVLIRIQISSHIKMRSSSQARIRNNTTLQKYKTIKEEFLKYQNDSTYRATFVKTVSCYNRQSKKRK